MLDEIPPRLGSRRPLDLWRQGLLLRHLRGLDERGVVDVTRLLTGSIADLIEEYFESDAMLGLLSVSGRHRHLGRAALGRHRVRDAAPPHRRRGRAGRRVGVPARRDGRGDRRAGRGGPVVRRRDPHRGARWPRSAPATAGSAGVTLASGEEIDAATVITTAHPQISFLRLLDPAVLPGDFVADIRRWQTRSGTVKINLALDRLPVFTSHPAPDPQIHGGTIVLAESLDDIETAFQQAVAGQPSALPFADICIPSVFDDSLAPPGQHVMSMFTQWVPHSWAAEPHEAELDAYADRVIARMEQVAPGFTGSVLHRQVIGPHQMQEEYGLVGGNIFHGELSLGQMFHARPGGRLRGPAHPGARACTRPGRPPTAAAGSPASRAATWCARSWPTAGPTGCAARPSGCASGPPRLPPPGGAAFTEVTSAGLRLRPLAGPSLNMVARSVAPLPKGSWRGSEDVGHRRGDERLPCYRCAPRSEQHVPDYGRGQLPSVLLRNSSGDSS